jgi:hypothetical protein
MQGLSVRWSLREAPDDAAQTLRDYVRDTSWERFTGRPGLCFKTWRMVPGEWFEGTYVFESAEQRQAFREQFQPSAAQAPGSLIIGSAPISYEEWDVVAIAEGGSGFRAVSSA